VESVAVTRVNAAFVIGSLGGGSALMSVVMSASTFSISVASATILIATTFSLLVDEMYRRAAPTAWPALHYRDDVPALRAGTLSRGQRREWRKLPYDLHRLNTKPRDLAPRHGHRERGAGR
jgi:hypothetical protein